MSHLMRNPIAIVFTLLLFTLSLAVACGSDAKQPSAPADTQAKQPVAATAVPQAAPQEDVSIATAGTKVAPSFESYWKPDTGFYGQPVYGGTLRINYEDPLEHANQWEPIPALLKDSDRPPTTNS